MVSRGYRVGPKRHRFAFGIVVGLVAIGTLTIFGAPTAQSTTARASIKPESGVYRGLTSQGLRMRLRVTDGFVTRVAMNFRGPHCGAGFLANGRAKVGEKGRFSFGLSRKRSVNGRFISKNLVRELRVAVGNWSPSRHVTRGASRRFPSSRLVSETHCLHAEGLLQGGAAPRRPGLSLARAHRTLDSHASRLRRKLDPEQGRFVVNCWGVAQHHLFGPIPVAR